MQDLKNQPVNTQQVMEKLGLPPEMALVSRLSCSRRRGYAIRAACTSWRAASGEE
jgi:hypothetical protein